MHDWGQDNLILINIGTKNVTSVWFLIWPKIEHMEKKLTILD